MRVYDMRLTTIILISATSLLLAERASGQSAFVDDGQDGAAIGFLYTHQDRITGFGLGASFSANGQADINASIVSFGSGQGTRDIVVIGLGATPYLRPNATEGVSVLFGLPVGVAFSTQSRASHTALIGTVFEVSILEGQRARLVLSGGISHMFLFDSDAGNSTVWTIGVGQSIPAGALSLVLGASMSQSTESYSDAQLAVHLDVLFTR